MLGGTVFTSFVVMTLGALGCPMFGVVTLFADHFLKLKYVSVSQKAIDFARGSIYNILYLQENYLVAVRYNVGHGGR
jgi:hypothetical protein